MGSNGQPVKPGPARKLGRVGQAKWTKDTGWAGKGSESDGHGRPSTFLVNNVSRFYKKIAGGARIWTEIYLRAVQRVMIEKYSVA